MSTCTSACRSATFSTCCTGHTPESEYVVLAMPSCLGYPDGMENPLPSVVNKEVDGQWRPWRMDMTPENISATVRLPGRKVLALACGSGEPEIARAFLDADCAAYIGAARPVDQDACALFTIGFFYHLLSADRDESLATTDEEAFALAAAADTRYKEGTQVFRYYAR